MPKFYKECTYEKVVGVKMLLCYNYMSAYEYFDRSESFVCVKFKFL